MPFVPVLSLLCFAVSTELGFFFGLSGKKLHCPRENLPLQQVAIETCYMASIGKIYD